MSEAVRDQERRSEPREPVAWQGWLLLPDGKEPCEIQNISCNGVHITASRHFEIGTEIALDIDHVGEHRGTVVWRDGALHGLRFDAFSTVVWHFLGCVTSFDGVSA